MAKTIDQEIEGGFEVGVDLTCGTAPQTVKAATTNVNIFITDITISTDSASSFKITNSGGGTVITRKFLPANGTWSKQYRFPKQSGVGSGLFLICSASSGNVTVDVNGYTK